MRRRYLKAPSRSLPLLATAPSEPALNAGLVSDADALNRVGKVVVEYRGCL